MNRNILKSFYSRIVGCEMQWPRLVQPPYKIGGDQIVVNGHRHHNLDRHILLNWRRLKRPSGQHAVWSGVVQRVSGGLGWYLCLLHGDIHLWWDTNMINCRFQTLLWYYMVCRDIDMLKVGIGHTLHTSRPVTESSRPRKRSQSPVDMLEHRDTYRQAHICSTCHQGSSVDFGPQ